MGLEQKRIGLILFCFLHAAPSKNSIFFQSNFYKDDSEASGCMSLNLLQRNKRFISLAT
jgi:hypothetical protein